MATTAKTVSFTTEELRGKELVALYAYVARKLGYSTEDPSVQFNCRAIEVAEDILEGLYLTYAERNPELYAKDPESAKRSVTALMMTMGPKINKELPSGTVRVEPDFIRDSSENTLTPQNTFMYNGVRTDFSKLMSSDEILAYLTENGSSDREVARIREQYQEAFGDDLSWEYGVFDGEYPGAALLPARDGILCLPYSQIDDEYVQLYELEAAHVLDEATCASMIKRLYRDALETEKRLRDASEIACLLRFAAEADEKKK